ncbi:MAG: cell division protein ZipA [Gammaproteobacteria bacterium]
MLTILGGAGAVAVVLLLWRPGQKKNKGVIGADVSASPHQSSADKVAHDSLNAEEDWEITPIITSRSGRHGLSVDVAEDLSISTSDDIASATAPSVAQPPMDKDVQEAQARRPSMDSPPATNSHKVPEDLIVVLNIMAHQGHVFHGAAILNAMHDAGLLFGEMQIFHYMYNGAPLFSLANALNPGSFDINVIENAATPGLTLFLRLPGPIDGLAAFDRMYSIATRLATTLGGEVCDGRRTILTAQALEKQREEIAEYQRGCQSVNQM